MRQYEREGGRDRKDGQEGGQIGVLMSGPSRLERDNHGYMLTHALKLRSPTHTSSREGGREVG